MLPNPTIDVSMSGSAHRQEFSNAVYEQTVQAATVVRAKTLTHEVEHAGYGAILSRLMTGLNRALKLEVNYHFAIASPYQIETLFDISVKQKSLDYVNSKPIYWNFFRDTWSVKTRPYLWKLGVTEKYRNTIRAQDQFPKCPLDLPQAISRHQWCAVLAHAICGNPKTLLQDHLTEIKHAINWDTKSLKIGVHVRRGDKNTECPFIPTQRYIHFCQEIINQNLGKKIQLFLASDDSTSLHEFSEVLPSSIEILWDKNEVRFNNANALMIREQPNLAMQESMTAAKNICLLGQCDYVIGMASAQFTWLGGLLAVFAHNLDTSRHIMIDSQTGERGHWACTYGYRLADLLT